MYSLADKAKIIKLFQQGKLEEIERLEKERLELDQNDLSARKTLITMYRQQERLKEAEDLAKKTSELFPDNLYYKNILVMIYIEEGELRKAERLAKEILKIAPHNLPAKNKLVTIYIKRGKLNAAENMIKEILEKKPKSSYARRQLKEIAKQRKKRNKRKEKEGLTLEQKQDLEEEMLQQDSLQELKVSEVGSPLKRIQIFRKQVQDGIITLENLAEHESELSGLPEVQQKLLLAEAYTKFNIPKKAIQLLKEARKNRRCNRTVRKEYYHKL